MCTLYQDASVTIERGIPIHPRLEVEDRHPLGSDDAVSVPPAEVAEDAGDVRRPVDDADGHRVHAVLLVDPGQRFVDQRITIVDKDLTVALESVVRCLVCSRIERSRSAPVISG